MKCNCFINRTNKEKTGFILIIFIILIAVIGIFMQDPVSQDPTYHHFKDSRDYRDIPNFWNVISNLPFLIVGIMGLYKLMFREKLKIINDIKTIYILLFAGIILIAFGSAYYHLWPDNWTLVWDRLAMALVFMALFSIIISEFISVRAGKIMYIPLILTGVLSVVFWYVTEVRGEGDLRFYALVQYLPMLLIPVVLIFFRSRYTMIIAYWTVLLVYSTAKLFEYYDAEIYNTLGFISGHSIKHITAALGLYILLLSYEKRDTID